MNNAAIATAYFRLEKIVAMLRQYRATLDTAKWIIQYAGEIKEILESHHNGNLGQIDVLLERELALRQAELTLAITPFPDAEFEMVENPK